MKRFAVKNRSKVNASGAKCVGQRPEIALGGGQTIDLKLGAAMGCSLLESGRSELFEPPFNAPELAPVKMVPERMNDRFDVPLDTAEFAGRCASGGAIRRARIRV